MLTGHQLFSRFDQRFGSPAQICRLRIPFFIDVHDYAQEPATVPAKIYEEHEYKS
jgi:hypothetical protein